MLFATCLIITCLFLLSHIRYFDYFFNVIFVCLHLTAYSVFFSWLSFLFFSITSLNYGRFIASRNLFSRVSFRDTLVVSFVSFSVIKNISIVYISESFVCCFINKYSSVSLSIKTTHRTSANSPHFPSISFFFFSVPIRIF